MPLPERRLCALLSCREPFIAHRYNALYHSIFCREKAHREQEKALKAVQREKGALTKMAVEKGWVCDPEPLLLDTKERMLIEANVEGGFGFYGHVPEWTPHDPRIEWTKGEQCWQMLFFPTTPTPAAGAAAPSASIAVIKPSRFDELGLAALDRYAAKPKE